MIRMSDRADDSKEDSVEWTLERRRVLQLAGVGISGLGMAQMGTNIASAATEGCADGPFQRSYESGTVNLGQLHAERAKRESPPDVSAAEPGSKSRDDKSGQPPYGRGQQAGEGTGELTIGTEYDGVNAGGTRGGVPSDSQIATGRSKNVHALNQQVAIFNKRNGNLQRKVQLEDIWEPVIPKPEGGFVDGFPFVFDPRARYDRKNNRFVLCAVQFQAGITENGNIIDREEVEEGAEPGEEEHGEDEDDRETAEESVARPPKGYLLVAVSATSNPNGKWYVYRIPPEDENGIDNKGLVDYPTLGLDQDAIYLTQNFFANDGSFEVTMVTLDKAEMYAGEEVTAHHFDNMNDPNAGAPFTFTVQPAFQPFSGGSSEIYYLVNSGFTSDALTLWEVTDPVSDPSLSCYTIEVGPYTPPPAARQPNSDARIDTLGTRLMNADYNDGSLWTAHTVAADWNGNGRPVAAIRWYEIDVDSRELVQSGVYGEDGTSYFIPTVGSNGDTTVIAHNVSGPETFPQMNVSGRTADFTTGEIEDSVVVQDGESRYDYGEGSQTMRWGDYNGVSLDPKTGNFWTVSQYSSDINVSPDAERRDPYHTRIAEVYFGAE
jgi:hypothetical protein